MIPENLAHVLSVRSTIYPRDIDSELDTIFTFKELNDLQHIRSG